MQSDVALCHSVAYHSKQGSSIVLLCEMGMILYCSTALYNEIYVLISFGNGLMLRTDPMFMTSNQVAQPMIDDCDFVKPFLQRLHTTLVELVYCFKNPEENSAE
uniref:Uncharacterized protein n=1 Tax=Glossina austeni TaxID=7395 RepID=A0A1A9UI00_GLOAU